MKLILIAIFLLAVSAPVIGQVCPPPWKVCLTQEQADLTASKLLERQSLLNDKIPELKAQVATEQQNVKDVKKTASDNEADLKDRLHKTELSLATRTGELTKSEGEVVTLTAMLQFMMEHGRTKCAPLSLLCGGH